MKRPCDMTINEILDPRTMFDLCKNPHGKELVKRAALSARTAFGVHQALDYLENELSAFIRPLTYEQQQNVCNIFYYCVLQAKHAEILAFVRQIPEEIIGEYQDIAGNA